MGAFGGSMGQQLWSWHQQTLRAMGEPVLACGASADEETYRLTWMHSFSSPTPLLVRVSRRGSTVTARASRFARKPGGSSVALEPVTDVSSTLTDAEWSQLLASIDRAGFWAESGALVPRGEDGSTWLVEGRRGNTYQSVARHSPDDGPFRRLALELMRLGQFDDPEPRVR